MWNRKRHEATEKDTTKNIGIFLSKKRPFLLKKTNSGREAEYSEGRKTFSKNQKDSLNDFTFNKSITKQ